MHEKALKLLSVELFDLEVASDQILQELGRRAPIVADDKINSDFFTVKKAAAAVITSPADIQRNAENPRQIALAMQIRRALRDATTLNTLENSGGAWLSVEELAELQQRGVDPLKAPGNLFYELTGKILLATGRMPQFTYDMREGFGPVVARNVGMELTQEMGEQAASAVELVQVLNQEPKRTNLNTINFTLDLNRQIAAKYGDKGIVQEGEVLKGVFTRIEEYAVEAHANIGRLCILAVATEEANGVVLVTIDDLIERGKRATESKDAWENYNQLHGQLRPRAPSTFWQVRMQVEEWLQGVKDKAGPIQ